MKPLKTRQECDDACDRWMLMYGSLPWIGALGTRRELRELARSAFATGYLEGARDAVTLDEDPLRRFQSACDVCGSPYDLNAYPDGACLCREHDAARSGAV